MFQETIIPSNAEGIMRFGHMEERQQFNTRRQPGGGVRRTVVYEAADGSKIENIDCG